MQGTHPSLRGSSKALATVTSIIDGTGSVGAAIGPFLAGAIHGLDKTFYMLMAADVCALLASIYILLNHPTYDQIMAPCQPCHYTT